MKPSQTKIFKILNPSFNPIRSLTKVCEFVLNFLCTLNRITFQSRDLTKILPSSLVGWQPRHNKIGLSTVFQKFLDFIWIRISSIFAIRMRVSDSFNQSTIELKDARIKNQI